MMLNFHEYFIKVRLAPFTHCLVFLYNASLIQITLFVFHCSLSLLRGRTEETDKPVTPGPLQAVHLTDSQGAAVASQTTTGHQMEPALSSTHTLQSTHTLPQGHHQLPLLHLVLHPLLRPMRMKCRQAMRT